MGNSDTDGSETTLGLAKGLQPEYKDVDQEKKFVSRATGRTFLLCLSLVNITSPDGNITSIMVLSITLYYAFQS